MQLWMNFRLWLDISKETPNIKAAPSSVVIRKSMNQIPAISQLIGGSYLNVLNFGKDRLAQSKSHLILS